MRTGFAFIRVVFKSHRVTNPRDCGEIVSYFLNFGNTLQDINDLLCLKELTMNDLVDKVRGAEKRETDRE
uniref:Uncharacterized protein n=1 Tax=Lepeophtheirus salmonis TaxID=72036 RepID=A0A0K2SW78_LEPSM